MKIKDLLKILGLKPDLEQEIIGSTEPTETIEQKEEKKEDNKKEYKKEDKKEEEKLDMNKILEKVREEIKLNGLSPEQKKEYMKTKEEEQKTEKIKKMADERASLILKNAIAENALPKELVNLFNTKNYLINDTYDFDADKLNTDIKGIKEIYNNAINSGIEKAVKEKFKDSDPINSNNNPNDNNNYYYNNEDTILENSVKFLDSL